MLILIKGVEFVMAGNYFEPFSLRVPEEIIDKMKIIAKQHKRSTTKEIELALELYITAYENEHGEIETTWAEE